MYVIGGAPDSWEQRLKAAELWAGDPAVVSHQSAGALWGYDGVKPGMIQLLTTGTGRDVPPGIVVHRTKLLARRDWGLYKGFRVTSMARTLFDLAAVVDPATFEAAAESALRKNDHLYADLIDRLAELGEQGRNGIAVVRKFLAERGPELPATESVLETHFLRLIRTSGLPEPTRQFRVWIDGVCVARFDFAYPLELKLGIRLNGKNHLRPERWENDQRQSNALQLSGWLVLDFTWKDVLERPHDVMATLRRAYGIAAGGAR